MGPEDRPPWWASGGTKSQSREPCGLYSDFLLAGGPTVQALAQAQTATLQFSALRPKAHEPDSAETGSGTQGF